MIKPLLRSIPTMSGNVKLACTLLDYNKISKDTFETNIRGAHLFPLSSQLFQKSVKVSLLNSSYEYDLKRFYSAYSDTFYSPCFEYDKKDIKMLDRTSVVYTRNTDFEYGVKRISYQKSGCQFACFAPIYIDNVNDIPGYFLLTVNLRSQKLNTTKYIRVNIGINGNSDYNYIYKYLKKYLSNIDDNVIYMDNTDKSLTYYGIDCINGGFTRTIDATVKNLFNIHMPIQMFDRTISIGFERNNMAIRQVLPLAFYFNVEDILTDSEKVKLRYADITFSGAYYDKNGRELKWYDFNWDYTKFSNDIYNMNQLNGVIQRSPGYTSNIMGVGFPALSDKYLTQYQFANKLTTTFSKWKLKYSDDEWPYITNMSWAYSNNQDSTYKYREFPVTFTNQSAYAIIDSRNKYNLRFPLGKDIELYNRFNVRSANKYEAIMNNYCLSWFDLYYPKNRTENIFEAIKRDKDQIDWVDVNNGYSYYKGVLYNFNLIYDKVSQFKNEDKIDKFAVIVHPDTMNIINDDNKDKITFTSLTILTKELNNTEQILNNCIFNKTILDTIGNTDDTYIPLFDIYDTKRTDNLLYNEIFDIVDNTKIDETFNDDTPIYVNSNDLLIDIYKSNTLIKPSEYAGIYKLSTLKDIKGIKTKKLVNEEVEDIEGNIQVIQVEKEVIETYFGANFINALITLFNTYETIEHGIIVTKPINKITVVSDDILFDTFVDKTENTNSDKLVYNYYEKNIISSQDKDNLTKIAKKLFYSDSKGRTVLDLISDFYIKPNIKANKIQKDLFNGNFEYEDENKIIMKTNMFSAYSYFSKGPEGFDINNNPNVVKSHLNEKLFNGDPVKLLLSIANVVAESMKMYQIDDSFDSCFPVIFTDFGYDMWELLPIFRGKLFTNQDGTILTSLKDIINTYNDPKNTEFDHIIKDIYISYNKFHSFNPEKLIYKSGEVVVFDEIKYQELLNSTYEHTLYYRSKFIDDTFLDDESFAINTKFFGPYCLTSDLFPLGDISIKETGTNAIYHGFNRIINLIKSYLRSMINNSPVHERFFYYPVKYYNRYNCGTHIAYKINENWNEYSNNVVYGDTMDNNVLYVHPYNFSKIMHNAITEQHNTVIIDAVGELDDVYSGNPYNITKTTKYYSGASVNADGDIVFDGSDVQYYNDNNELTNLNNTVDIISEDYIGSTKMFESKHKYVKVNNDPTLENKKFTTTEYRQKINENTLSTEGMFKTTDLSGINISDSDKVELFAKVYNAQHLSILLNMKESDFECVTGFKEVDGTFEQIIDKIGTASENRFYEQHKRMFVDANTGYIKVKYEYIPIDFNKKYIIPDINIEDTIINLNSQLMDYIENDDNGFDEIIYKDSCYDIILSTDNNGNIVEEKILNEYAKNRVNEILDELSQYYSIISYKSMIIFDNSVGMFKKYKVCKNHINDDQHTKILNMLRIKHKNEDGSTKYDKIYKHTTGANTGTIPNGVYEHVEIKNNEYVYEYFNIVEKNTFIKINQSIKDYINLEDSDKYKDMYIYRPILDMEYDEKYSQKTKCESLILDLSSNSTSIITDTSTMLYPCFNTIYKQELDTTLLQLNIAVDNIRDVKLIKYTDLPNVNSRQNIKFSDLPISDSYYRYVLKDNALFISVTKDEYEMLCNKVIDSLEIPYDLNGNPIYKYIIWKDSNNEDLPDLLKSIYMMYELIDEDKPFYNYESVNNSEIPNIDEPNKFYYVKYDPNKPTGDFDTSENSTQWTNGLRYYIKGNPLYDTVLTKRHIPLKYASVYNRRYIPNPIYFSVNSNNETYSSNLLSTFNDNGTIYGYYLINSIVDNSSNTLNIRAMLDTDTSTTAYDNVDNISNINYVSIINDNDITTPEGLEYYLYVFKQLCPFMYNNITSTMLNINTIIQPETFNITNTYSTKLLNTVNKSSELNLIYNKHTIMSAKKQLLQRYTNAIVPYISECNNIENLYKLKLKECNATLLDTGNYLSIGDSVLFTESQSIHRYQSEKIYGVSNTGNSYNNVIGNYTPLEYKFYNNSKMINLETYIENKPNKRFTYDELLIAESDAVTFVVFGKHIKRLGLSLTNDEILFLYNKYEKKYDTKFVGMSIDNSQKLYSLTYKFNLL